MKTATTRPTFEQPLFYEDVLEMFNETELLYLSRIYTKNSNRYFITFYGEKLGLFIVNKTDENGNLKDAVLLYEIKGFEPYVYGKTKNRKQL